MKKRLTLLTSITLFTLTSCSLFLTKTYTWDWRRDHPEYHRLAIAMIQEEAPCLLQTIPKDIQKYCSDYNSRSKGERLEFWGLFLSAISWMESSHRTEHFYEELGIKDSTGENVISRGLLQFSYESSTSYLSSISEPNDLHTPEITLRAGAIALKRFICIDQVVSAGGKGNWKGAARYWSVLRNNPKHIQIQQWLNNADYSNPRNNLIPPPPHVMAKEYEPWISSFFRRKQVVSDSTP